MYGQPGVNVSDKAFSAIEFSKTKSEELKNGIGQLQYGCIEKREKVKGI